MKESRTAIERAYAAAIRDEVLALRGRLRRTPDANPLIWPIAGQLACAQRPLRDSRTFQIDPRIDGGDLRPDAGSAVIAWLERVLAQGIQSVICLLHAKELKRYDGLHGMQCGFLALYEEWGLVISHIPWPDPARPENREEYLRLTEQVKARATEVYLKLPKAVLLHCSAAIDRSTPVAARIKATQEPS